MAGGVAPNTPAVPREVARLRELFLSGGELPPGAGVTAPILESWARSADRRVSTDHVRPPYRDLPDALPDFATVASRVLDRTTEALGDEPVCVILTDAEGTVLLRWCGESSLRARVDRVDLAPGFAYSEPGVGTNGIGTALERGVPTLVHATEHFSDDLIGFTCAGVPVRDPRTGVVLGVVDLTTGSGRGTHLMLGFARTVAAQIEEELRRGAAAVREGRLDTPGAGGGRSPAPSARGPTAGSSAATVLGARPAHPSPPAPAGLPDRAPAWLRAHRQVVARAEERLPTALVGERGVGKAHLALVAHRVGCVGSLEVLDAARPELARVPGAVARWLEHVGAAIERDTGTLLLRRIHLLPDDAADGLRQLLDRFASRHPGPGGDGPWLVVTADASLDGTGLLDHGILGPRGIVEVPPLRHHPEDVPDLVARFLARHGSPLVQLTPDALDVLARHVWPGNVAELDDVVAQLALTRHSGTADVADLPVGHRERARHRLTALEALERDAIVRELVAKGGSKDAAARALGISRATLYRRLREYGIAWPGEARAARTAAETLPGR